MEVELEEYSHLKSPRIKIVVDEPEFNAGGFPILERHFFSVAVLSEMRSENRRQRFTPWNF